MRISHACATAAAVGGLGIGTLLAAPATAQAAGANYVALGDSYSAGVGAGNYTSSSGSCDRSTNAYPQLWANNNAPSSFTFVACSGATTSDVLSNQVSSLNSSTTLVSLTIGGNDAGFSSVMETCVLDSDSACQTAVSNAENFVNTQLPAKLDTVLSTIKSDAPNAKVVVLGYPEFYDLNSTDLCIGLDSTDRAAINGGADALDTQLQAAASRHGDAWGDVRNAFKGHELCDDGSEWLHAVSITDISESYHPTASGQSGGYLPVFTSAAG